MNDNNNNIRELKIDSTLWATPAKIINLLDFKPEKLSIKTENNDNIDIKIHQVRYENGGFYLTIDNIKGYFSFSDNINVLSMIFSNDDKKKNKYHEVWKEIFKIVRSTIKLYVVRSIVRYRKSLIEKNKFYLELALNHCLYEI